MVRRDVNFGFGLRFAARAALLGVLMALAQLPAQPTSFAGFGFLGSGCQLGSCGHLGTCGAGLCGNGTGTCLGSPDFLGSAPTMLGDFLTGGGIQLRYNPPTPRPLIDMTIGGGPGRVKIADNNKALPQDRVYFNYNYFNNAARVRPGVTIDSPARYLSFSRYTVGLEKAFFGDQHSLEVRVPFTDAYEVDVMDPGVTQFGVSASRVDNLTVIYKYLLDVGGMGDTGSAVTGIGINIPSGDDTEGSFADTTFEIQNETLHLMPYIGFLGAEDATFFHMFIQLDVVPKGNPIVVQNGGVGTRWGKFNEQHLLHIDASLGRWLFPDCCPPPPLDLIEVAGIVELHYTSAFQSSDEVTGTIDIVDPDDTTLTFSNFANRFNIFNVTAGLHFQFGRRMNMSFAGALPLRGIPNRSYDAQVLAQVNYQF